MKNMTKDFMIQSGEVDFNVRFKSTTSMFQILQELKISNATTRMRGASHVA